MEASPQPHFTRHSGASQVARSGDHPPRPPSLPGSPRHQPPSTAPWWRSTRVPEQHLHGPQVAGAAVGAAGGAALQSSGVERSDVAEFTNVPRAEVIRRVLGEERRVIVRILPPVAEGIHYESLDRHMCEALIQQRAHLVAGPNGRVHITAVSLWRYRANEVHLVRTQDRIRARWPSWRHTTNES
jgi:hypothetical protein